MRFLPLALLLVVVRLAPAAELPGEWAYKPATKPAVPKGSAHPVDAFLLAKLEAAKLGYSPPAAKAALLRRVTFDLTGLPPTPAELAAFEKDTSPTAYEKVVDRLLASSHFGERVAVWWLDLARYAESDGFKADAARPTAWRYRDYVIDSFNTDKPYDRFLREQLAADEIAPNDPTVAAATGFLRHYPDESNAVNLEQRRQEILNDITDTTAAAFLGITLGCAKCHDHKTDPVSQDDYYRMQAFFAGFWPSDRPVLPPQQQAAWEAKTAAWEAKTAAVRKQMAEIEEPFREKASKKERSRFDEDYAKLIDIPFADRTPWQKQIAEMCEKQVVGARKFTPTQMKGEQKTKWEGMQKQLAEHAKEKPTAPPTAMAMTDVGPVAPPQYKLKRGDWRKKGDELDPGFISSIDDRDAEVKPTATSTGRRTALANWIADAKNPLTARVMVNRVWQHVFERGLVATTSDFGLTGEKPTHPELLDWLANDFTASGWSVKHVYRLLVTSAAYRQAAEGSPDGASVDPENDLLWHAPRKRLDGESLRDAMLAVCGVLNEKAGGPSVFPELPTELKGTGGWTPSASAADRNRRSVYVAVKRNLRYPFFTLFDAPDRSETCSRRFVTTTAPQSLMLLNDTIVLDFAKTFAARLQKDAGDDQAKIVDRAFRLALSRPPTADERDRTTKFLAAHPGTSGEAVADLCHALLNLNEFLYVD
ncbi:DUF1549 and DUF1553 domain-containing protein [Limnoglobus roseus]|uniref:DUF1553 domain-containing protein n=1 Tax=Limnoglobus roseus TaxID=2598579 RepID=A0A5C1AG98_9BACT|nr:DUF1549 and DUF1553 domain-containing protein [Limnoglobus roseus]QEL15998.1 hypothetical protein PX52LOC_02936 [Limnoglobus roseus]